MKILVLGKNGQVASELRERLGDRATFLGQNDFTIQSIAKIVAFHSPNIVINCAAYTAVDKAESEPEQAYLLNTSLPSELARASKACDAHLIHFSTDYVFDGRASQPYHEEDETHPLSVYGKSKRAGEVEISTHASSATILRTSWVYSKYGANFVKTMIRLSNAEKPLRVVSDQIGTPTWAGELAGFVVDRLFSANSLGVSTYHFSGSGETSWNGFAREIAAVWQTRQREIAAIPTSDYPTPAQRPLYGVLSKDKLRANLNYVPLDWREALRIAAADWETK